MITLLLFSVTAILVMRFIVKYSKKEQARAESQYEELRHQDDVQSEHRSSSDS
ncbi:hypothetical protein [Pontibacillus halophilus]|uniref:hypothetical protein n=1 Tax=Pontibacillus halophilus TaxID=516704 RepID=UPI001E3F54CD|nr:hypothetical protein [Pontibacillus halophilus]